jgi:hypothetical protein
LSECRHLGGGLDAGTENNEPLFKETIMQRTGTDTVRKLDLTRAVNDAKKAAGHVKGIGDRATNAIMSAKSEVKN